MNDAPVRRLGPIAVLLAVFLVFAAYLAAGLYGTESRAQPVPTATEEDGPVLVSTLRPIQLPPTAVPTRTPRPTPTPTTPPREVPTQPPTSEPIDPQPPVTAQPTEFLPPAPPPTFDNQPPGTQPPSITNATITFNAVVCPEIYGGAWATHDPDGNQLPHDVVDDICVEPAGPLVIRVHGYGEAVTDPANDGQVTFAVEPGLVEIDNRGAMQLPGGGSAFAFTSPDWCISNLRTDWFMPSEQTYRQWHSAMTVSPGEEVYCTRFLNLDRRYQYIAVRACPPGYDPLAANADPILDCPDGFPDASFELTEAAFGANLASSPIPAIFLPWFGAETSVVGFGTSLAPGVHQVTLLPGQQGLTSFTIDCNLDLSNQSAPIFQTGNSQPVLVSGITDAVCHWFVVPPASSAVTPAELSLGPSNRSALLTMSSCSFHAITEGGGAPPIPEPDMVSVDSPSLLKGSPA